MNDRVDVNRFGMSRRTAVAAMAALGVGGGTARPTAAAQSTSATEAEAALRAAWSAAWSSGSGAAVAAIYTEDCVYEDVPSGTITHGRDELAMFAQGLFDTIADIQLPVDSWTATPTVVTAEWRVEGTHRETGRPVSLRGVSLLGLADGLFTGEVAYYDSATFLTQTGGSCTGPELMPMDEATPEM